MSLAQRGLLLGKRDFSPPRLGNLLVWLAADRLAGYANTDPVSSFTDLSGNGWHAVQATGSKQPLYRTGILNTRPVLRFDGTDDSLSIASLPLGAFTGFLVFTNAGSSSILWEHGTNSNNSDGGILWPTINTTVRVNRQTFGVNSWKNASASWGATGDPMIACHTFDGTHAGNLLHVNGALPSLGDHTNTGDPGTAEVTADLFLFSRNNASLYVDGDLAELIVYKRALSTGERIQVTAYLGAKYKIAVTAA